MTTSTTTPRDIIKLSSKQESENQLHLLPCVINHNGPANTSTYFIPTKTADQTLEATFRGRQLFGRETSLPENYTGHVLVEEASDDSDQLDTHLLAFESDDTIFKAEESGEKSRVLVSSETFDSLIVWEHDRVPMPDDDEFIAALEWIDVAASIHMDCST